MMTMNESHFADRLLAACRNKGAPVCVGLDPVLDRLPKALRDGVCDDDANAVANALKLFSIEVIDAVADHVPAVKPQMACFERYLWPGTEAYHAVVAHAREKGLIVVGDAKRGDIGQSSQHYAAGDLADNTFADLESGAQPGADSLTVNGYLGDDALQPFIDVAREGGKGLFVLVRTSNPGGDALQGLELADGRTVSDAVADMIAELGEQGGCVGQSGYSLLGAVVGATKPQDAARLRRRMPRQIFLVPGFGAQGGTADDVRACFNGDGQGALITASRSVIYAFDHHDDQWQKAISAAAIQLKLDVADILK